MSSAERKMKVVTRTVILADGTYGTEEVYEVDEADGTANKSAGLLMLHGRALFCDIHESDM